MGVLTTLIRSITGYVQGIITSKQNLRTSIIGKEVDVPESAKLAEYSSYVDKIKTDGIDTTDATATSSDMRDGVMAYANDKPVYGNLPTRTASDIDIDGGTVRFPAGIYDANEEATIPNGTVKEDFIDEDGEPYIFIGISATPGVVTGLFGIEEGYFEKSTYIGNFQLPTVDGQTFVPSNEEQVIVPKGKYTTGDIKIAATRGVMDDVDSPNVAIIGNSTLVLYTGNSDGYWDGGYTDFTGFPDEFLMSITYRNYNTSNSISVLQPKDITSALFLVRKTSSTDFECKLLEGWAVGTYGIDVEVPNTEETMMYDALASTYGEKVGSYVKSSVIVIRLPVGSDGYGLVRFCTGSGARYEVNFYPVNVY